MAPDRTSLAGIPATEEQPHGGLPARRDRDLLPAIEPERRINDWGRSERITELGADPDSDKALVQTLAQEIRARIQEGVHEMVAERKSVWFG